VIEPTYEISKNFLWRFIDAGLIDGVLVNGSAAVARGFGWMGSRLQTGNVGIYAWVLVVGVVALLGAFTMR
jgi:NADH-quinone oxidoreductase subunit L